MIRINLLPHREEKRKAKRKQFFALVGLVSILAVLIVLFGWTLNERALTSQDDTNAFLKVEVEKLDKQIAQIKMLKDEIAILLKKKEIIETLQRDRGTAVTLLVELARQVPEGAYLKSMRQNGMQVDLTGVAQSNSRVSELMRNLEQSPAFENPRLNQTQAATVEKRRMQEFSMSVNITPVKLEASAEAAKLPATEAKK